MLFRQAFAVLRRLGHLLKSLLEMDPVYRIR
jgi:hypothetical protein